MIHFKDGGRMTWAEAARKVRAEGKLYQGRLYSSNGERCAWGVITDANIGYFHLVSTAMMNEAQQHGVATDANDNYDGTPEQRAEYMARKFDAIHLDDPECSTPLREIVEDQEYSKVQRDLIELSREVTV